MIGKGILCHFSQVEVPSYKDEIFEPAPSESMKMVKTETKDGLSDLEKEADRAEGKKHGFDVLKKKGGSEGDENEEVNGSEVDTNEEEESEGDENEEEFESEGDEDEEVNGSEVDTNEEEDVIEGDENEDMNKGDENKKLADEEDFDNKHERNVEEEGAGRKGKVEVTVTGLVTEEGNINEDSRKGETTAANVSTNSKKAKDEIVKEGKDVKNSEKEDNKSDELKNAGKKEALAIEEVKMVDGMGLIFTCNAKTKQDCFRYKILGMPASKKELVEKIYKGMRLFLYDVDLKLMYGIFKATAPGGYDIEPKAFKSAYPAQVRFRVLKDCLPLPEEKFKAAIEENYYGENKFSNKLSSEQVKKLCMIFQTANNGAKKKRYRGIANTETEPPPPWKRPHWTKTDIKTIKADQKPVHRASDVNKTKASLVRTSSHVRGHDYSKQREAKSFHTFSSAHKRSQPERGRWWWTPPPAALYSRREEAYLSRAAMHRVTDLETRHHQLPHDLRVTDYHRDALSMHREPHSLYHVASSYDRPPPPTAYAHPPPPTAYARPPPPPLYYRY